MKKKITTFTNITLLVLLMFLIKGNTYGQLISLKKGQYEEIKKTTLHFVLTDNYMYNSLLKTSVRQYWTFSKYDFITWDEYLKMCSIDSLYFTITNTYSRGSSPHNVSTTQYNPSTSRFGTSSSTSSLNYQDDYTVLAIIKGDKKRNKITKENYTKYVNYKHWRVTIMNEELSVFPRSKEKLDKWGITDDTTWYNDPISYKIALDIRSLQFLIEYHKIAKSMS